ncbi:hypothetical protein [Streptomyces sp. NPDC005209]
MIAVDCAPGSGRAPDPQGRRVPAADRPLGADPAPAPGSLA